MVLELNGREKCREFYGRHTEQMPNLIADGRTPMSVAELIQIRLDVRNSPDSIKSIWMDNYFDTGDSVAYHPDGNLKIVLDSPYFRDINPDTPRNIFGALILTEDVYNALEGEEFKKGKSGKVDELLSKKDVKSHPVWKILARDQTLLNEYADLVFAEAKERFGYNTAMGIFLRSADGENPEMRGLGIYRLEGRSSANGRDFIGSNHGRLLGMAPKVQELKSLEGKL